MSEIGNRNVTPQVKLPRPAEETSTVTEAILSRCLSLEVMAAEIYRYLASMTDDPDLKKFWKGTASEEDRHITWWTGLLNWARENTVPDVFDDPAEIERELTDNQREVARTYERIQEGPVDPPEAFMAAFHTEFYLMHPAFCRLMQLVEVYGEHGDIRQAYEDHISSFLTAADKHNEATPELRLITKALLRLWRENRSLTAIGAEDVVTGALSRRAMFDLMTPFFHLANRTGRRVAVLMLDIDHFSVFNNVYGHRMGDRVLRHVVDAAKQSLRRCDLIGRYGGDEFMICLTDVQPDYFSAVAQRISRSIEEIPGLPPVTISIGGCCGAATADPQAFLRKLTDQADAKLRKAKASGRNAVWLTDLDADTGA